MCAKGSLIIMSPWSERATGISFRKAQIHFITFSASMYLSKANEMVRVEHNSSTIFSKAQVLMYA